MNGPHDLGGCAGFGAVRSEPETPVFHSPWEARALALNVACNALGYYSIDARRHARERLPHTTYLTSSYYRIWTLALEDLLRGAGELSEADLAAGHAVDPARAPERCLRAEAVAPMLARGGPVDRPPPAPAQFAVGDAVRTRNHQPKGHTRLPAYAREKRGTVEFVHGAHVYPDSNAHAAGEHPTWVYTVAFDATELWGAEADPDLSVSIDAFEPYLERA